MSILNHIGSYLARDLLAEQEHKLDEIKQEYEQGTNALRDTVLFLGDVIRESVGPGDAVLAHKALQESGYDDAILQDLLYQIGWDQLGGVETGSRTRLRKSVVEQAERLFCYSPITQWAIWLWTSWGIGDNIEITLDDDNAQAHWDDYWGARRNTTLFGKHVLHEMSEWTLVKGNRFLVDFTNKGNGEVTTRLLPQEEIVEILTDPGDRYTPLFYKREYTEGDTTKTLYYPDWSIAMNEELTDSSWTDLVDAGKVSPTDARADKVEPNTHACVQHIAHNRKEDGSLWGWPITSTAGPWVKGHKQFMEARLGVAMAISQFVRRSQIKGGSRAVASVLQTVASTLSRTNLLDSNPPPSAASWHVENEASNTRELGMRTGAGDAKQDNEAFSWMALLGMGLFPTSAGLDTSRWATAVEMDKAQSMLFARYRIFWSEQIRTRVEIVISLAKKYGAALPEAADLTIQVSTDTFSLSDFPQIAKAVSEFSAQMMNPTGAGAYLPDNTGRRLAANLWRITLQALGVEGVGDLTSDEAFGILSDEEIEARDYQGQAAPDTTPPPPEEPPDDEPEPETIDAEQDPSIIASLISAQMRKYREGSADRLAVAENLAATHDDLADLIAHHNAHHGDGEG